MNRKYLIIILSTLFSITSLRAEIFNFDKVITNLKGLANYKKNNYQEAEQNFTDNALKYPSESKLHFNMGNTQYKNGSLEEAENSFNLTLRDRNFAQRSQALQNLGNIKFDQKQYPDAIKYFRDALIEDPSNKEAQYNYEVTSKFLQKQQNQKQQSQQSQDENKEEKEQKEQKNQQDQQDQQQDQQQQDEQEQRKQDEQSEAEKQEQQELKERKEQKKEDAEKILKALLQKEKEEMKKEKQKMNTTKVKTGKYW
ncbi:MAG: tetratricopeptide repeat protein [Candidatus Cloacimonetes bacterium]|nr:tetratricopeptide repeat protein [Candidatus Cloacimonadota bacterium]